MRRGLWRFGRICQTIALGAAVQTPEPHQYTNGRTFERTEVGKVQACGQTLSCIGAGGLSKAYAFTDF